MPDERKANVRYGATFWYFLLILYTKAMFTEYSTFKIVSKSAFNRY